MNNNWGPSSWKESFTDLRNQYNVQDAPLLVRLLLSSIYTIPLMIASSCPVTFIVVLNTLFNFSSLSIIYIFLSILTELLLYVSSSYQLLALKRLKNLTEYLTELKRKNFSLKERKIEDYITEENVRNINNYKIGSLAKSSEGSIARVLLPISNKKVLGQDKGFAIPVSFNSLNSKPLNSSVIFLSDEPDTTRLTQQFIVLHEIGHTTKYAYRSAARKYTGYLMILFIFIITFQNLEWYTTIIFLIYFIITLKIFTNTTTNFLADEIIADTFAINNLEENTNWQKLSKRMNNLFRQNGLGQQQFEQVEDELKIIRKTYFQLAVKRKQEGLNSPLFFHEYKYFSNLLLWLLSLLCLVTLSVFCTPNYTIIHFILSITCGVLIILRIIITRWATTVSQLIESLKKTPTSSLEK